MKHHGKPLPVPSPVPQAPALVFGILIIVIGAIILYQLYKTAKNLLPPTPPPAPPPPTQTNNIPTNSIPVTNMVFAQWSPINNPLGPNNPYSMMYGIGLSNGGGSLGPTVEPIIVSQHYGIQNLDNTNNASWDLFSQYMLDYYNLGVNSNNFTAPASATTQWVLDATGWHRANDTNTVPQIGYDPFTGLLTVSNLVPQNPQPYQAVVLRSDDMQYWTPVFTNPYPMTMGQFTFFVDPFAPTNQAFYKFVISPTNN